LVHDSHKQISLVLNQCGNISDVSALGHVYALDLSGCRNASDISALGHVHTLNLSGCDNVSDAPFLQNHECDIIQWRGCVGLASITSCKVND
jgi:hypothetical protein